MRRVGSRGTDGDYGEYDGTLDNDCIDDSMGLIADWYDDHAPNGSTFLVDGKLLYMTPSQRRKILRLLGVVFCHTFQIVVDILHRKVQGNPSGNPITVIINSMCGEEYLLCVFLTLAMTFRRTEYYSLDKYEEEVADMIFGDDNGITATEPVLEWFNPSTISKQFEELGIKYTSADKSGECQLKTVDELRFLKCGFVGHPDYPDRKLATLDEKSIYELTNWIRKCPDEVEQLRTQLGNALRFAYFHGLRFYEELRTLINRAIS